MGIAKQHSLACEPIKCRRLNPRRTEAGGVGPRPVVGQEEENIGPLILRIVCVKRNHVATTQDEHGTTDEETEDFGCHAGEDGECMRPPTPVNEWGQMFAFQTRGTEFPTLRGVNLGA